MSRLDALGEPPNLFAQLAAGDTTFFSGGDACA